MALVGSPTQRFTGVAFITWGLCGVWKTDIPREVKIFYSVDEFEAVYLGRNEGKEEVRSKIGDSPSIFAVPIKY